MHLRLITVHVKSEGHVDARNIDDYINYNLITLLERYYTESGKWAQMGEPVW